MELCNLVSFNTVLNAIANEVAFHTGTRVDQITHEPKHPDIAGHSMLGEKFTYDFDFKFRYWLIIISKSCLIFFNKLFYTRYIFQFKTFN